MQLVFSTNKKCTGMQYEKRSASMPLTVRCELGQETRHVLAVSFLAVMSNSRVVSADG